MKKTIAPFLALALLLLLTACGGTDTTPPAPSEEPNHTEEPAAPPVEEEEPEDPAPLLPDPEQEELDNPDEIIEDSGEIDNKEPSNDAGPSIHVSHTDVTLRSAGDSFRLTIWNSDGNAPDVCTYTSADPSIASVDEAGGEVVAVSPGTTTITVLAEYAGEKQEFSCIVRCNWTEENLEASEPGNSEPNLPASGEADTSDTRPSLESFYTTLQNSYEGLDAMMVMEGELLDNFYPGMSGIAAVEEVLIQETMISISNIAVGLVKLSSDATPDDVLAVQAILQARVTAQAEGGAWYPESCETWEKAVITSAGNCVGMFVYPDQAQELADLFTSTFGS